MSNDVVHRRVSGADSLPLTAIIDLNHLRWYANVLRKSAHRLSFRALPAGPRQDCKKGRGIRAMMKLTLALASAGVSHLHSWGPRDLGFRWL